MPKRSRVREETLLGMLEEEEIVSEAQPELAKKDEDGRATKKQKRDHYRQKKYLFCRSRPRAREKFPGSDARMLSIVHEEVKREKFS